MSDFAQLFQVFAGLFGLGLMMGSLREWLGQK